MFESPAPARPLVTLDPWAADYGTALGFEGDDADEEESPFEVDHLVETGDWSEGLTPAAVPLPETVVFVDGVQRVEYWARVDDGEQLAEAAFASVAAGSVVCRPGGSVMNCELTSRVFAVSGGAAAQPTVVQSRNRDLIYEVSRSDESGHRAVLQAIAVRRRELELSCVRRMLGEHPLVVADGRLDGPLAGGVQSAAGQREGSQLVGVAKTLQQLYLKGEQRGLIARLAAGTRTPVFLIKDSWGSRYSWFLRLPHTRPIHHSYAGIVRLEIPAMESKPPLEVVDMVSHHLPRFASKPEHDPRAPQNLLPVGALERQMRHELGDVRYIRRLIEDQMARGG